MDADVASEALAALEVAAGLKGRPSGDMPEGVEQWLETNKASQLPENFYVRAEQSIVRILSADSELKELWEESDSFDEWLAEVNHLKSRIKS